MSPARTRLILSVAIHLGLPFLCTAQDAPAPPAQAAAPEPPVIVPTDLFTVPEGLEVTVWATSPMLRNPTNIDFDKEGRLWVTEGVNYRSHQKRQPQGDRVVVLEDSDGDGKADKSDVFVQEEGFIAPLGIGVLADKVIVSQPPDLIVFTDVDGDRKFDPAVDKREVVLTGFNGKNHDHSLHSVTAGPDGQWYWNMGNTGAVFTDKSGKTFRIGSPYDPTYGKGGQMLDPTKIAGQKSDDGNVWIGGFTARMNPDGSNVAIIGHNYRNSYEQAVTSLGDIFQSDNDDPPACRVTPLLEYGNAGFASLDGKRSWSADRRPGQSVPVAEWRQEDPGSMPAGDIYGGGSPTGVAFYENGALGDKWRGLLLACEAGRNVIFGYLPKPDGAGFKLERFDFITSNKEGKFAGSDFLGGGTSVTSETTTLFRPSDVAVGPDGALYVADWFDPRVGGHSDLDKATAGTIYRIAPKGFKSVIPKFDLNTTAGQIEALKSPAVNVRNNGFVRLKEQGEAAVPAVVELLRDSNPFIAARAVWLLAQMGPAGVDRVRPLLEANDDSVRLVAYRALRRANQNILGMAQRMASDRSPAVRREVALTMHDLSLAESREILVRIASQYDGKDRSYLEAFGTGCKGKEREIYREFSKTAGDNPEAWTDTFAQIAWRLSSPDAISDFKQRALSTKLSPAQRKQAVDSLAFVKSPFAALAMVEIAAATDDALKKESTWWLFNRRGGFWKDYGIADAMKERGLYDPENITLTSIVAPPAPGSPSSLPPVDEVAKLAGDAERGGAAVAACYTCHKIGSQGNDFGPDLTAFGKTQTRETIVNAIISPSAEISHGYEGKHLETNDGIVIDGIVVANEDPVFIKSMGGQTQTVPKSRIKSITPLDRSLMFPAEMMGLNAQAIADVVAYLQSDKIK